MSLQDAVVIVTGSATGVGAAVARQCAEKGAKVVINYTKSEEEALETQKLCEKAGAETLLVKADISKDADCKRMAEETIAKWGRIDGLVNNAGVSKFNEHANLDGLEAEDFQWIYGVNVIGTYQMIRACAPQMQKQGAGSVVNVSSIAGVTGIGSSVAYAASKGALNTMTLSLARALAPAIRVNGVCPGFIQTRWLKGGLGDEKYEALKKQVEDTTPLKAASTPEEIAEPIVWLLEGGKHVTGELVMIDAGTHLGFGPLAVR